MVEKIIFLVKRPGGYIANVIVAAVDRDFAKSHASHILGGDPENYVVEPLTERGSRTLFILEGN